ncbi:unnamed protein product [Brachionus calyciflorus]|uniref:Uncharacterized protein n=1 Tax=Brachionus calyciflorus TaxID=104777 RepID=A0A814M5T4_9BILA|nr:unnamed protein product [Brachionus calyciflorus]
MKRQKLSDLMIYHPSLDSSKTIELLNSFINGDREHLEKRLNKKNVNNPIGLCAYLPLELAIIFDHSSIFSFLINELKADLKIQNKCTESFVFISLAYQRRNFLFNLINLEPSSLYSLTHENKRSLIHEAVILDDSTTLNILINKFKFYKQLNRFKINKILYDKFSCSPLYYACWLGHVDIANFLLDIYLSLNLQIKDSSLGISILNKRFDIVENYITKTIKWKFLNPNYLSEMDCWLEASTKLANLDDFERLYNIFHELQINQFLCENFCINSGNFESFLSIIKLRNEFLYDLIDEFLRNEIARPLNLQILCKYNIKCNLIYLDKRYFLKSKMAKNLPIHLVDYLFEQIGHGLANSYQRSKFL